MKFHADLRGHHEVPYFFCRGYGTFGAELIENDTKLTYDLGWDLLESDCTKVHIHLGKEGTNGGAIIDLGGPGATVVLGIKGSMRGTLSMKNVRAVTTRFGDDPALSQGIGPTEFEKFVTALKAGHCYVNIHTTNRAAPVGEIRGQIRKA